MMSNDNDEFREFERVGWERVAESYQRSFLQLTAQTIDPLLEAVDIRNCRSLLDVACGPGHVAARALELVPQVAALDISEAMIRMASTAYPEIEFRQGDAENLPYPDASFDAVVMNFGMLHLAHPHRSVREACRVLKPGSRFAFSVWATPDISRGFGIILRAVEEQGSLDVGLPEGPSFFLFSDHTASRQVLDESGFKDVRFSQVDMSWRLGSGEEFFEAFYNGSARTGALLRAQSEQALLRIRAAVLGELAALAKEPSGSIEVAMSAIVASAAKGL